MALEPDNSAAILARLEAIAVTVTGDAKRVLRNEQEIPDDEKEFIVINDADEVTDANQRWSGRPASAPIVMGLEPEIFIAVNRASKDLAAALRTLKNRLIKAVMTDTALLALCKDGEVRYEGTATSLANGRGMVGQAKLIFRFMYVLIPARLP